MKAQYIEIDKHGNTHYYSDRKMTVCHREDGPAFVSSYGSKSWLLNGKLHREDGPAIVHSNGDKDWCLNGEFVSEAEHARLTAAEIVLTLDEVAAKFGVDVSKLKITK